MKKQYNAIIVGGGIIGASIFHRLSQDLGKNILLIEKSRPGFGATAFSGGILRAFHLDSVISDRALRGMQFYKELKNVAEEKLVLHRTGFLNLIDNSHHDRAEHEFARQSKTLDLEWISANSAKKRFGLNSVNKLTAAVYEPEASFVDPLVLSELLLDIGKRNGGTVRFGIEMQNLKQRNGKVLGITTNVGDFDCDNVILCTGAWSPTLTKHLQVQTSEKLRSKCIQVNIIESETNIGSIPAFIDLSTGTYGRPDEAHTALIGCPVDAWDVDPDIMQSPVQQQQIEALTRAEQRFEWVSASEAVGGYRRCDAYTHKEMGITEWSPSIRGVLIAAGFSGNGVKLAPATADIISGMIHKTFNGLVSKTVAQQQ